jgi:hypothetical protein
MHPGSDPYNLLLLSGIHFFLKLPGFFCQESIKFFLDGDGGEINFSSFIGQYALHLSPSGWKGA